MFDSRYKVGLRYGLQDYGDSLAQVMIQIGSRGNWYQSLIFVGFYVPDFILFLAKSGSIFIDMGVKSKKNIAFVFGGYFITRPLFFLILLQALLAINRHRHQH